MDAIINFFKRIFAAITAFFSFLFPGGNNTPVTPPPELPDISQAIYSFYEPTEKVLQYDVLSDMLEFTMYAAKNEAEYCQLAVRIPDDKSNVQISLSNFEDKNGNTIDTTFCEEYYIKTSGNGNSGYYPDALVPLSVGHPNKHDMKTERNYLFFIGIKTTSATLPGDYTARFTLKFDGEQQNTFDIEIKAHIWDFELPVTPSMDTAVGLGRNNIAKAHEVAPGSPKAQELYEKYYEFLLEHKLSAFEIPVDLLSDEADKYINDPRCTSFGVNYGNDNEIRAYAEKLESNPYWADKSFFYPIDEPASKEAYEEYDRICARLSSLYPEYNMVTPFYINTGEIDGEILHAIDLQEGKSNIMCPETILFDEDGFAERAYERQSNGDKLWWYVCSGPAPSSAYCNLFTQYDGIKHRILFWQQKQYNVTGFLYWNTTYWTQINNDPWSEALTNPSSKKEIYGDGTLLYDGHHIGLNDPVSSLRLEAVTNGIEDYEYLTIAEKLFGKNYVDETISKISTNLTSYTLDDTLFSKVRIELGNAIESGLK